MHTDKKGILLFYIIVKIANNRTFVNYNSKPISKQWARITI